MRTHFAERDAIFEQKGQGTDAGDYWSFGMDQMVGSSGGGLNNLTAMPFLCETNRIISRVGIEVDMAGGASIRIGMYSCFPHRVYPHRLIFDAGTISGGSEGFKTLDLGTPAKIRGNRIYFLGIAQNQNVGSPYWGSAGIAGSFEFLQSFLAQKWSGCHVIEVAHTWGALPDPFPAGGTAYRGARAGAEKGYGVLFK